MDALEQELIIRFIKLDLETKQRLLDLVGDEFVKLNTHEWLEKAKRLHT